MGSGQTVGQRLGRAEEHGAFANAAGKPDRINAAPPRTLAEV